MSEMVAKVALAIFDKQEHRRKFGNAGVTEPIALARAAIEAMREPTPAMVDAADPHGLIRANFEDAWRAMVDEALR